MRRRGSFLSAVLMCISTTLIAAQEPVTGEHSPTATEIATSKQFAERAAVMLRNEMKDPGSFTLLGATAFIKEDKDSQKPSSFRGCFHYVASNSFGGREQSWGGYHVDKKGTINVFGGTPGDSSVGDMCMRVRTRESYADVGQDVAEYLAHH
jgi:hypothetical protein